MKNLTNITKRHYRVRTKVNGTSERPRLSVFRSNKHIFAQVIDDTKGVTIAGASTRFIEAKKENKTIAAKKLGETLAKKAMDKGVKAVVFDRGGYKYHGRVKAVAEGAREAGLVF